MLPICSNPPYRCFRYPFEIGSIVFYYWLLAFVFIPFSSFVQGSLWANTVDVNLTRTMAPNMSNASNDSSYTTRNFTMKASDMMFHWMRNKRFKNTIPDMQIPFIGMTFAPLLIGFLLPYWTRLWRRNNRRMPKDNRPPKQERTKTGACVTALCLVFPRRCCGLYTILLNAVLGDSERGTRGSRRNCALSSRTGCECRTCEEWRNRANRRKTEPAAAGHDTRGQDVSTPSELEEIEAFIRSLPIDETGTKTTSDKAWIDPATGMLAPADKRKKGATHYRSKTSESSEFPVGRPPTQCPAEDIEKMFSDGDCVVTAADSIIIESMRPQLDIVCEYRYICIMHMMVCMFQNAIPMASFFAFIALICKQRAMLFGLMNFYRR